MMKIHVVLYSWHLVDNTSMNPSVFGKSIRATDMSNTNFQMSKSNFYSNQLNSWHKLKHDFELFTWLIIIFFLLLRNDLFFFSQLCWFRLLLWTIKRHFIFSSKNGRHSMDSLYSIFSKYWGTYKFSDITFKINPF